MFQKIAVRIFNDLSKIRPLCKKGTAIFFVRAYSHDLINFLLSRHQQNLCMHDLSIDPLEESPPLLIQVPALDMLCF